MEALTVLTHPHQLARLTEVLVSDRKLRRIFYEALDTADEVVACRIAGIAGDAPTDDLWQELNYQLREEHPVEEDVFQLIWSVLLDDIYYRCAAAGVVD
jgi:hypothetical protein